MKVVMAPQLGADLNPYQELLQRGIEESDPDIRCEGWTGLSLRRFMETRGEIDVLHLHWMEHLYLSRTTYRTYRKFLVAVLTIALAKVSGKPVVYTVHNVNQHGNAHPILNRLGNELVFRLANAIHVHDESGREAVASKLGRTKGVFTVPHGSYIGFYPNNSTRDEARRRLGIPLESFVYLCLGQVRAQKGLEGLLEAFSHVESPSARLVVAGWAPDTAQGECIRKRSERDPRVMVHLRHVPRDDIHLYFNACNVCVLPYKTVTTSGAALLAFSFGRPIVAPGIGCFPELIGDQRGILYEPGQPGSLDAALAAAQHSDLHSMGKEALFLAERLDWTRIGGQHTSVYRELVGDA